MARSATIRTARAPRDRILWAARFELAGRQRMVLRRWSAALTRRPRGTMMSGRAGEVATGQP